MGRGGGGRGGGTSAQRAQLWAARWTSCVGSNSRKYLLEAGSIPALLALPISAVLSPPARVSRLRPGCCALCSQGLCISIHFN